MWRWYTRIIRCSSSGIPSCAFLGVASILGAAVIASLPCPTVMLAHLFRPLLSVREAFSGPRLCAPDKVRPTLALRKAVVRWQNDNGIRSVSEAYCRLVYLGLASGAPVEHEPEEKK